ncbi:hypothetical protein HanXRQr2_Chr13g0587161 [Helianthus annuus]|uniref:Uncharacterized protein n=1 Tax=Helianthus annuus TaxID=4232 RepID=A0A9K3HAT0_HELAN|nr:hypothetical protein HanXRQr2_Chr13g0587161 [Helianthus annuus]KAJ0849131.1 hypothetical protein HanPSC8_Chr13g0565371 [Helianthus annuus]
MLPHKMIFMKRIRDCLNTCLVWNHDFTFSGQSINRVIFVCYTCFVVGENFTNHTQSILC